MRKVIISDLDGTLLRSDKTISEKSINILRECKNKGDELIFATARPPRSINQYIPSVLKNEIVICYNGALVLKGNDVLYEMEISKNIILEIIELGKKYNLHQICLEINDKLYSNFDVTDYFGNVPCEVMDVSELNFEKASKVIVCTKGSINKEFTKELPIECSAVITDNGTLCQIMHAEVSKWNSIQRVLQHLNRDAAEVIAFGDDYNDMEMIEKCGIGVAMSNAVEELKSVAKFIAKSNDEDGVATFLESNSYVYIN
ncbi:HAD family hydrolase [Bacillus cereus]|uniref:HAD family hydrolase n=1 Tax=Bacillus cereus TaxID=1396 RepID=A0A2B2GAL4_BACCE|nr:MULTISPECIES: HAD family hydrolase [Bacillus cereus group]MDR4984676.1 HAD family hydrolase [Bacillus cereus]MEA1011089.1 HAD family hydrolase [Bacillus cereus]PES97984.1 HAD family hydrolase [Bacillus cereus]PFP78444.1 HAD family hydrolase [Bacillus cereus]PGT20520.1 HAD family hydrolase [Bacillus cereus]